MYACMYMHVCMYVYRYVYIHFVHIHTYTEAYKAVKPELNLGRTTPPLNLRARSALQKRWSSTRSALTPAIARRNASIRTWSVVNVYLAVQPDLSFTALRDLRSVLSEAPTTHVTTRTSQGLLALKQPSPRLKRSNSLDHRVRHAERFPCRKGAAPLKPPPDRKPKNPAT